MFDHFRRPPGQGLLLVGLFLSVFACANPVLDWNAVMLAGIRSDNTGPTLSTRNLAILHLAIYDAVNAVKPTHQPYHIQPVLLGETSVEAAAMAAGYETLKALYPGLSARTEEVFGEWRANTPNSPATTNGMALGRLVAQSILQFRGSDGSATEVPYIPSADPGQWRRTPPFFRPPLTPHWRYVRPFALPDTTPFLPPPPPALNSTAYAVALNEVRTLGGKSTSTRTAYQSETAIFWSDFSYTSMPPGHWHEIAGSIIRSRDMSLAETARLMALLSLAQADTAIVVWEAKFRYNFWRPVTAIQRADEDENAATDAEIEWLPLLADPPFPAYVSGHSAFSTASAIVLAHYYGTDAISFTAASDALPGVFRNYESLSACAEEVGQSRVFGGIHFPFDNTSGKSVGRSVADYVLAHRLLPFDALPLLRIDRYEGYPVIRAHGQIGQPLLIEKSTDLTNWKSNSTYTAVLGGVLIPDASAGQQSYWRVRQK